MSAQEKILKAVEILKATRPGIGKIRPYVSEANSNEVIVNTESGYYCTVNIRSRAVKGV